MYPNIGCHLRLLYSLINTKEDRREICLPALLSPSNEVTDEYSLKKNTRLKLFLKEFSKTTKFHLSGVWRQYDGQLLSWTPWWLEMAYQGSVAPQRGNCALISLSDRKWEAGRWSAGPCKDEGQLGEFNYICEITTN